MGGFIAYEGPSLFDDSVPVVVVVTGFRGSGSSNRKTGAMLQSYILRADIAPTEVITRGLDEAICGTCPHRSRGSGGSGACYVNVGHGPRAVWACYKRGGYPVASPGELAAEIEDSGRMMRVGTYGDPAAVPVELWEIMTAAAVSHTGYTHAWKRASGLRGLVMASVDTREEAAYAQATGWHYFRVGADKRDRMIGEARCPASAEAGHRVTCETCPLQCNPDASGVKGRFIAAHGASAKRFAA